MSSVPVASTSMARSWAASSARPPGPTSPIRGPAPIYFDGTVGLEGCVAWVLCASVELNAGLNSNGFYAN